MKSVFTSNQLVLTNVSKDEIGLTVELVKQGFNLLGGFGTFTYNYPLYTNATEAKQIYRQVQNDLKLKLANK